METFTCKFVPLFNDEVGIKRNIMQGRKYLDNDIFKIILNVYLYACIMSNKSKKEPLERIYKNLNTLRIKSTNHEFLVFATRDEV